MFAMQYDIHLPRDYDMEVIRRRVAERGHALDRRQGLGLKAYLVRDISAGAAINSYSPFYIWSDEAAAARFLWGGGGFGGIVRDFGRPRVHTWLVGEFQKGHDYRDRPRSAALTTVHLAANSDPEAEARRASQRTSSVASSPSTHCVAWMIDASSWKVTSFTLSSSATAPTPHEVGGSDTECFEVLHLSSPEMDGMAGLG